MLTQLKLKDFSGVPHLATSELMVNHKGKLRFSNTKPNVLVGPNGSGKSALLTTLAIDHLAFYSATSTFDEHYVLSTECNAWWSREREWGNEYTWLRGLTTDSDRAPAIYYRPDHIPGNEVSVTHAMMTGYFDSAKEFALRTENKSSGQKAQALQEQMLRALAGQELPTAYGTTQNWRFGTEAKELDRQRHYSPFDYQAEILKRTFVQASGAIPVLLMDEPEQSLDALAQASLWSALSKVDCSKLQVIVATHSLYPLLHREDFNVIETVPGYTKAVVDMLR